MKCPWCGAPVIVRGNTWECGYCGDHGQLGQKPKLEKGDFGKGCLAILVIVVAAALLGVVIAFLAGRM